MDWDARERVHSPEMMVEKGFNPLLAVGARREVDENDYVRCCVMLDGESGLLWVFACDRGVLEHCIA